MDEYQVSITLAKDEIFYHEQELFFHEYQIKRLQSFIASTAINGEDNGRYDIRDISPGEYGRRTPSSEVTITGSLIDSRYCK